MFAPFQLVSGLTDVWLLWIVSVLLLLIVTRRLSQAARRRAWRLARSESGSSYILTVAIIIPFYATLIAVITECTLLLVAKIGTTYAACAAARSAAVWLASDAEPAQRRQMVQFAAAQAVTPFASGNARDAVVAGEGTDEQACQNLVAAYQQYAADQAPPTYLLAKSRYAQRATTVDIQVRPREHGGRIQRWDVTVRVTYLCPISVPGLGLLFGEPAPFAATAFHTREMSATATMELETPKSKNRKLGIHYDSWNY